MSATALDTAVVAPTDTGVEVPTVEAPVKTEGVGAQLASPSTFQFSPIDPNLTEQQRQDRVLELLQQTTEAEGKLDFIQGELLYEASKNKYWEKWTTKDAATGVTRPFNSWDEFVEEHLGLKRRTAFTRMDLYSTCVVKLQIPVDQLKNLDLSKVAQVTKILTPENYPAVLDALSGMSWAQTKAFVAAVKSTATIDEAKNLVLAPKALPGPAAEGGASVETPASGAASKDSEGVKTFSQKLTIAQFENVKSAIEVMKTASGVTSDAAALDAIASEYLASNSTGLNKIEVVGRILQNLETTYGVVVEIKSSPADLGEGSEGDAD